MGQAKKRGSLEERIKQAQDRYYGQESTILPEDAQALGYIIHLPDQDEFVSTIEDNDSIFSVGYAKLPELAKVYDQPDQAITDAKKIKKHKLLVCVLFESSKQYFINDLWANY